MKNSTLLKTTALFIGVSITFVAISQPPPPPPPLPPSGVPLDGGLVLLLASLFTYGLKNYFNVDVKKVFSFLIIALIGSYTQAQIPGIQWQNAIGGNFFDDAEVIIETNDKGFLVGGRSMSDMFGDKTENLPPGSYGGDFWVLKLDSIGNILWQNSFGGVADEYLNDAIQTSDGGYLLAGTTNGTTVSGDLTEGGHGSIDYLVVKLDATGNVQWQNTIGGNQIDRLLEVVQTNDGGYILGGSSNSGISFEKTVASKGAADYWIIKLNSSGVILWQKAIGGSSFDYLEAISLCNDGGVLLAGHSSSPMSGDKTQNAIGAYDYWVVKVDSLGNVLWDKTYGGTAQENLFDVTQDDLGNFYLAGSSESPISGDKTEPNSGFNDFWIVKINPFGSLSWENTIGGSSSEFPRSIDVSSNYQLVVGGHSVSGISGDKTEAHIGGSDYWLVNLDTSGTVIWDNTIGGTSQDNLTSLTNCQDGGIAMIGRSASPISGDKTEAVVGVADYWVVKIEPIYIWTGLTNTDWFTASNWSSAAVPDETNIVVVPDVSAASNNFPVIDVITNLGNVEIQLGASLTVESGIILENTFANNGSVLLKDGAFLDDFSMPLGLYHGSITLETIAANGVSLDQRMISSPVNNPNVSEIGDDLSGPWGVGLVGTDNVAVSVNCPNNLNIGSNYGNIFEYNESLVSTCPMEGWVVRSAGNLNNGKGYSAYLSNASTFDFTGVPNTGNVNISLSNSSSGIIDAEGWNLIGNPYPSPISRDEVINAGVTDAMYFVTSGVYQGSYFPYLPGSDIAIAQGFQVHTATNQTITFDNSFRSSNTATWYSTDPWFDHKLEISVLGNGFADKTILYYDEEATNAYDALDDVVKVMSKQGQPSLSTLNNSKNLALNGLSIDAMSDVITMNLDPGTSGNFSLSFEGMETFPLNTTIYLKDLLLNEIHDISNGDYAFSSSISDDYSRFELIIVPAIEFELAKVDCNNNAGGIQLNSILGLANRSFEIHKDAELIASDDLVNLNQDLMEGTYELTVFDAYNGSQLYLFEIEKLESAKAEFSISSSQVSIGELFTLENLHPGTNEIIWELDNQSFSNVDELSYSFNMEGVYEIKLEVSNSDCIDYETQEITVVSKTTSTKEESFVSLFVYPNPANTILNIDKGGEEITSLKLIDYSGRVIADLDSNQNQFDVSAYDSGIYFLQIANKEKRSLVKLVLR